METLRFERIDAIWTPIEVNLIVEESGPEFKSTTRTHHKVIEIELNPNHDVERSFLPDDIRNGTRVGVLGTPGLGYTWRNGQLVPRPLDENIRRTRAVFDNLDKDKNGTLSPKEFAAYLSATELPDWAKALLKSREMPSGVSPE